MMSHHLIIIMSGTALLSEFRWSQHDRAHDVQAYGTVPCVSLTFNIADQILCQHLAISLRVRQMSVWWMCSATMLVDFNKTRLLSECILDCYGGSVSVITGLRVLSERNMSC